MTPLGSARKPAIPRCQVPATLWLICRWQKLKIHKAGAPHSDAAYRPHRVAAKEPPPSEHRVFRCTVKGPVPHVLKSMMYHDALAFDPKGSVRLHRRDLILRSNRSIDTRNGVLRRQ